MSLHLEDLADRVIIVTGAGSGIGAAVVRQLLDAGARVAAGELYPERLDDLAAQWGPDRVVVIGADVSNPASADLLIDAAVQAWGRVDSVIANAGVGFFGGVQDVDADRIRTMVDTNFLGTVWLARAAVAHFRSRAEGGDIVVMGSVAGLGAGGGNEAIYSGTKAAQIQFATSLDREVRSEGIRVAVVAPAGVNTGFAAATGRFGERAPEDGDFIQPDDIAYAVLTTLRQPRRIRTAVWTMWSLSEANG